MQHGTGKPTHSPIKQDAPRWKHRAHGCPAYVHADDTQVWVSHYRQRELDKQREREEIALALLKIGWTIFKPVKSTYNPVIAGSGAHLSIRRETVARLVERGLIVDHGKLAYRLVTRAVGPVPVSIVARDGADAVALLPAKVA